MSMQGLFEGRFTGVDENWKGAAVGVPTPKSVQDTVAWTPVIKSKF